MKSKSWRFIDTGHLSGPLNMSIDESLLSSFIPNFTDPILRFYGWDSPSLSLGRFQKPEDVLDLDRCRDDSLPVIRRISGGGVIYHVDELTYSIVCTPEDLQSVSTVKESFLVLTGFLINFYRNLGLDASYAVDTVSNANKLGLKTAFCFAGKESFDILIKGKKIGGNAQRRHKNIIFQHGSIPIVNHAISGLEYMSDRSPEYAQSTTSLLDCGVPVCLSTLKNSLVDAFKRRMGVDIYSYCLSRNERHLSEQLLAKKYSTECWNLRGEVE